MKAKELLKIDFNKYTSISINGVLFRGLRIISEDANAGANIIGFKGHDVIMCIHFSKDELIKVNERKETLYVEGEIHVKGKEIGRDETN